MVVGQDARARLFVYDDALVLPQLPRELVGARIDGVNARRAAAQQHVGEAAGRRADIDRDRARHVPAEMGRQMIQGMVKLDPAARHPWMVAALDAQLGIVADLLSRLDRKSTRLNSSH